MNLVAWWLMALMMAEFALGLFLVFGGSNVPWYKRATAAFFGLGCFVISAVLITRLVTGQTVDLPPIEPTMLIVLFVFVNIFGFRLVRFLRQDERPSGFLGSLLKMAGCLAIGWAGFALVLFVCAFGIFLVGYFS
ncbi:MAG: hypothetical protein V4696_11420 [Pseudomonadota bacterium]